MTEHVIGTTTTTSLDDLLVAAGRGDRAGFVELYDVLAPTVHGLVSRLVGEPGQAESLARDVFLEVWHTSSTFDPTRGSARAWVTALAHRRAVDRARATGLRAGDEAAPSPLGTTPSPWTTLSSAEQETVALAYFGARTHVDVARLTQSSVQACQARMTSGLGRLRDALVAPVAVAEPA